MSDAGVRKLRAETDWSKVPLLEASMPRYATVLKIVPQWKKRLNLIKRYRYVQQRIDDLEEQAIQMAGSAKQWQDMMFRHWNNLGGVPSRMQSTFRRIDSHVGLRERVSGELDDLVRKTPGLPDWLPEATRVELKAAGVSAKEALR